MATNIESNRDYSSIEKPYNNFLERSIPYTSPNEMANSTRDANNNQTPNTSINSTPSNGSVEDQPVNNPGSMGDVWIKNFIRSSNWKPKKIGFTIDGQTGYAEFTNVFISGHIQALTGTIGGWTIGSTALYLDGATDNISSGMASADYPFYAGKKYADRATAPFRVTPAGALTASSATITGAVTIQSGSGIANLSDAGALAVLNTVGTAQIDALAVNADKIAASAITTAKIAADAVTAAEIATGAVGSNEIAAGAVIAGKITAGTIVSADIATGTITAGNIAANTITASQIAAGTITATEMTIATLSAISANLGTITAGTITGALIETSGSGLRTVLDSVTDHLQWKVDSTVYGQIYISAYAGGQSITMDTDDGSSGGVLGVQNGTTPGAFLYFNGNGIWVDSVISIGYDLIPESGLDLGSSSNLWAQLRVTDVYAVNLVGNPSGSGSDYITFNDPFILRSLPAASEPSGVNGMMYYDITNNRIRAYVSSAWKTVTVA
jgi:hypothetical protein